MPQERRRWQEEVREKRRQLEEDKRALQHLKVSTVGGQRSEVRGHSALLCPVQGPEGALAAGPRAGPGTDHDQEPGGRHQQVLLPLSAASCRPLTSLTSLSRHFQAGGRAAPIGGGRESPAHRSP